MTAGSEPFTHPPHYTHDGTYADLLAWHLEYWGTRPNGSTTNNGQPWDLNDFRLEAFSVNGQDAARTGLHNWLGAKGAPNETNHSLIQQALFGNNPAYEDWRKDLDEARERSPKGKNQRTREFPDPPPVVSHKASIPRPTAHFMGRDDERDALAKILISEDSPTILIQGGPGIGKTELTKAIAHHPDVAARFGERRYFIPLETAASAAEMQAAIVQAMGQNPQYGLQAALNTFRGNPALLILDNLETPWENANERERTEDALADLFEMPGIGLVASIRGYHFVGGAQWKRHRVEELSLDYATDLFAAICGKWVRQDAILDRFLQALGGLPLALYLVSRRACGSSSLAPLWAEWKRIGVRLAQQKELLPGRLTSLVQSIEFSLLSDAIESAARRLFRFLGYGYIGLRFDDVKGLLGDEAYDAEEQLRLHGITIEKDERITLLPPIREYASQFHPLEAEDKFIWSMYFIERLNNIEGRISSPADKRWNPTIDLNYGDVMGAIELRDELQLQQELSFYKEIHDASGDQIDEANVLKARSLLDEHLENYDLARTSVENAIRIYRRQSCWDMVANCLLQLSDIEYSRENSFRARTLAYRSLTIFRKLGIAEGVSASLKQIEFIEDFLNEIEGEA